MYLAMFLVTRWYFPTLEQARKNLGLYRIVTLEGELLETSGAMTGGSNTQRSSLRFGNAEAAESEEVAALKTRLVDIERVLERCREAIATLATRTKQLTQELTEARQARREQQLQLEQLQKDIKSLTAQLEGTRSQLSQNTEKFTTAQSRLEILDRELPGQETQLQQLRHTLAELEASQTPSEWQQIQAIIKTQEQAIATTGDSITGSRTKIKKSRKSTATVTRENPRSRRRELSNIIMSKKRSNNQITDTEHSALQNSAIKLPKPRLS